MHPVLLSLAKQQPATTGPLINSMSIKIISAFAFGQIPSILSCLSWRQSTQKGRLLAGSTRVLRKQRTRPKIVKVVFLNELGIQYNKEEQLACKCGQPACRQKEDLEIEHLLEHEFRQSVQSSQTAPGASQYYGEH